MSKPTTISPFKFLDSYKADDRDIFFGREREVEEIYDKVFQSRLLLLYGASGTGKSSIVNCGLANQFEESDWFPIHIRRGGDIRRSMFNQIAKQAINRINLPEEEETSNEGLQKALNSVYLDHFKPIYLIFDQFEELFIFGLKDEWISFIRSIRYLMDTDLDVHFIFIIRGEYLEFLSEFEQYIPEFFDNRLRVEKVTRKKAEEIIRGPLEVFDIEVEDGFEEQLLNKLSPDKAQIELTFLQVFLDKVYKNAIEQDGDGNVRFSRNQLEQVGQFGDVLAEFVDEQLFQMHDSKAALQVLKSFVSLQGTKVQNTIAESRQYCRDLGVSLNTPQVEDIIREFVNRRILSDHDENGKYELRHDSLAQRIYEKVTTQEKELLDLKEFLAHSYREYQKRGLLLNDEDLDYVSNLEKHVFISQEIRKFLEESLRNSRKRLRQRRRRSAFIAIVVLLAITSAIGFIYSNRQKKIAQVLAKEAESQRIAAEEQKSEAEEQRALALENEIRANNQAVIAEAQRNEARMAQSEAERQRIIAMQQRNIAETEKKLAEDARSAALASAEEARQLKEIAEQQRQAALKLRSLSLARELALKSLNVDDASLKTLLSLQAWDLHQMNAGDSYDPDIYRAIYESRKQYFPVDGYKKVHNDRVAALQQTNSALFSVGHDGVLYRNQQSEVYRSEEALSSILISENETIVLGTINGDLIVLSTDGKRVLFEDQIHEDEITAIAQIGTKIATTGLDGTLGLLDLETLSVALLSPGFPIRDMVSTGEELWLIDSNNRLFLWEKDQTQTFLVGRRDNRLTKLAYDPTRDQFILGTQEGNLILWDKKSRKTSKILSGHNAAITDIDVSMKGEFIASASLDRTVRVWPIAERTFSPIILDDNDNWASAVAFRDQKVVVGSFSGSLKEYEIRASKLIGDLCQKVGRTLTKSEWDEYVTSEIKYKPFCNEK